MHHPGSPPKFRFSASPWPGLLLAVWLTIWLIVQGPWPAGGQGGDYADSEGGGDNAASEAGDIATGQESIGHLYRRGLRHLRNGEAREAEAAWQSLLRRAPNHFNANLGLGKLLLRRDSQRALRHLNTATDLRPGSDAAHYHLGRLLQRRGDLLDAAEQFRKAIKLNARHYSANARLRKIIRELRSRLSVVERAAEQFWSNPNLAALTLFGKIVMRHSEPRQALLEFELMQQRLPDLPETQLWIARAQRQLGSLQGEIAAYQLYVEKNKDALGVRLLVLERLLEAGRFRQAGGPLAGLEEQTGQLGRKNLGRFLFLKSRFQVAQGQAREASQNLLAAAAQGFDATKLEQAFQNSVTMFPELPRLWLDFGAWLKQQRRQEPAVEAYFRAAKLEKTADGEAVDALSEFADQEPPVMAANLALGELALERGDQATAIARLERIPPGHQQDGRAALLLGAVYRGQGDLDKALDAFTRYVFSFPDRAGMAYARGNLFWVIGKRDIAVARWSADLEAVKSHPEALRLMAGHYQAAGESAKELNMRGHLRTAAPNNLTNRIRLGDLLLAGGQLEAAAAEWEQAARLKTGDFALLVRLGKAYLELGARDKGISALRRAAQIGDLEPPLAEKLARHLMAGKRYAEALDFYWQIYRSRPDHPDLPRVLPQLVVKVTARPEQSLAAARYAEASGQGELAIELLEELLRLHTAQGAARIMLARLYVAVGEPAEAERTLSEGGPLTGVTEVQSLKALAQVQRILRKREPLAQTLAAILKLEPGGPEVTRELAFLLLNLKHPADARPHLSTSLEVNPGDREVLYGLARAEFELKRSAEAETHLKRLLELDPGHVPGLRLHIRILRKAKRWNKLTERLDAFLARFPRDAEARYGLISAYLNLFDIEKARPHYEILKIEQPTMVRALHSYFQ